MESRGLRAAVGRAALGGRERVLAADEDEGASPPLPPQELERLLRHEEGPASEHPEAVVPGLGTRGLDGRRAGEPRRGDDQVDAPELLRGPRERAGDGGGIRHVGGHRPHHVPAVPLGERAQRLHQALLGQVHEDHGSAPLQEELGRGAPDPGRGPRHEGDLALQGRRRGHAIQLGLLQAPVLDPERLGLVEALVAAMALGPPHHANGVAEELGGDPRLSRAGAERQHPEAGNEEHHRIGAAQGRVAGPRPALVVGRVVRAVGREARGQLLRVVRSAVGEDEGQPAGPQEVVGAGRPRGSEPRQVAPVDEVQDLWLVTEVRDPRCTLEQAAKTHRESCQGLPPIRRGQRLAARPPVVSGGIPPPHEVLGTRDEVEGVALALGRVVAPGDQAVARHHDAPQVGRVHHQIADGPCEGEAGARPADPPDLAAEGLRHELLPAVAARQGDDGVGVRVVHVRERQQRVQRRVDACGPRDVPERAEGQQLGQLVVLRPGLGASLELPVTREIDAGEAVLTDRAEVPSGPLDPQHEALLPREGIQLEGLGRGVPSPEVGHGGVSTEGPAASDQAPKGRPGRSKGRAREGGDLHDLTLTVRGEHGRSRSAEPLPITACG